MFEGMIDNLDSDKWAEIKPEEKNAANFKEYHVVRNHKQAPGCEKTMCYCIAVEDGVAKNVVIKDCQNKKDPLKQIGLVELQLNEEENEIIAIDLNDEIVVRK